MNRGKCEGFPRIFPDSKPHLYIDFMSSQCTVIVYVNPRNSLRHDICVIREHVCVILLLQRAT